jgi:hypothetical protein
VFFGLLLNLFELVDFVEMNVSAMNVFAVVFALVFATNVNAMTFAMTFVTMNVS